MKVNRKTNILTVTTYLPMIAFHGLRPTNVYTISTKLVIEKITRGVLKNIVIVISGYMKMIRFFW